MELAGESEQNTEENHTGVLDSLLRESSLDSADSNGCGVVATSHA